MTWVADVLSEQGQRGGHSRTVAASLEKTPRPIKCPADRHFRLSDPSHRDDRSRCRAVQILHKPRNDLAAIFASHAAVDETYARNAKTHDANQVTKIAASMATFGWTGLVPVAAGRPR